MQSVGFRQFAVGVSVFLMGGVWVELVVLGIVSIAVATVVLVLCGVYVVYSAGDL